MIFRVRRLKSKIFYLIIIIFICISIYYKFTHRENINKNSLLISQLKDNFGNNLYINVDEDFENEFIMKSNENINLFKTYKDNEFYNENERRRAFDFYRKLKRIYVNNSLSKSIQSYRKEKFVQKIEPLVDWKYQIFGPSQPHIIKSINVFPKQYPEVANGYLGIQGFSDEIQIQAVFSGSHLDTRRASIPAWTIRNITNIFNINGDDIVLGHRIELDMGDARLLQIHYSEACIVQQTIYAHQTLKSLLVHEIEVEFQNSSIPYVILSLSKGIRSDVSSNVQFVELLSLDARIKTVRGKTHKDDQANHEQMIYAYYHVIPSQITVYQSRDIQKFYYLLSVNEDKYISQQHFNLGIDLMERGNQLFQNHTYVWKDIWSYNGILMTISDDIDVPLITAQYLLMTNSPSFGRKDLYGSIGAPGLGVPSNQGVGYAMQTDCNGRIEYDQELWMTGFQTVMNPESIKSLLKNRMSQLSRAKENAKKSGYEGARFPAVTNELGEELCPKELCKDMHFPTGMVALMLKHYLMMTGDATMFTKDTGIKLLMEINSYYLSVLNRSTSAYWKFNSTGPSFLYKTVQNSVFNVGLLKEILLAVPVLVHYLEYEFSSDFAIYMSYLKNISDKISLPFNQAHNYNPPHDSFEFLKEKIDYPEGVMLRYPLDSLVNIDAAIRNAEVYEKELIDDPNPMAMASMFIANIEAEKFEPSFIRWDNIRQYSNNTFKIWSKVSDTWNGSYIPSAAAYLDSVVYGVIGLRIRKTGLYLKPKLLQNMKLIQLSCITYLDSKIKLTVDRKHGISLELMLKKAGAKALGVMNVLHNIPIIFRDKVSFPIDSFIVIRRLKSNQNS